MTGQLDDFRRAYAAALQRYLDAGDEPALSQAYELGRRAMTEGWGLLDLAAMHREAQLAAVMAEAPAHQRQRLEAAGDFFHELLAPFEMSLRGYRSANDDLRRLNALLRHQKEEVQQVNRELESFSYSVSHDLRAPLRTIDGFSQILIEDFAERLGEDGRKYLGHVRSEAQRMAQLIDDMLRLARIARSDLRRTDVDMSAMIREIAGRLQASAPSRSATFTVEEGVHAKADQRLVGVAFENLLGNAWKFTSKRPHAEIGFRRQIMKGAPTYVVTDNGAGFDMQHAEKLFGAFQRLHSVRDFEGTGIGLATVQRIVHRHGGKVWATSEVDRGATFYLTLGAGDAS